TIVPNDMFLNSISLNNDQLKLMAGYACIIQDDLFNGLLTVYET
ncbi:unnamed protein product, partial [Rotaria sordida]